MKSSLRIIVSGMVGLYPLGGVAWDYFQYVIGLAGLGHDVYYFEHTWTWPYHPVEERNTEDGSYSARFLAEFFKTYAPELSSRWRYLHLNETGYGMSPSEFDEVARTADVFLNISGACIFPDSLSPDCIKVFLDTDPGYNQIMLEERHSWSENVERWCRRVAAHDRHFTYAENMYGEDCTVPKAGFRWKTTRMPVVPDLWKAVAEAKVPENAPFTTVMTWNVFKGKLTYKGVEYKGKGSEFERLIDLPRRTPHPLKVAVGGQDAPLNRIAESGWQVVAAPSVTLSAAAYQEFIIQSRGEISAAKHVYVAMRSGWFSCRSVCYLAGGRPVITQDTGFSRIIPGGLGLIPFTTMEEAAGGLETIMSDYGAHASAAVDLAYEFFDSAKVLTKMIEDIFT